MSESDRQEPRAGEKTVDVGGYNLTVSEFWTLCRAAAQTDSVTTDAAAINGMSAAMRDACDSKDSAPTQDKQETEEKEAGVEENDAPASNRRVEWWCSVM